MEHTQHLVQHGPAPASLVAIPARLVRASSACCSPTTTAAAAAPTCVLPAAGAAAAHDSRGFYGDEMIFVVGASMCMLVTGENECTNARQEYKIVCLVIM